MIEGKIWPSLYCFRSAGFRSKILFECEWGVEMKKNVRLAIDVAVLVVGILLLSGIFLSDRIFMQYGSLQISPTDLSWSHYQKLENLQRALKHFEEYKGEDLQNDYRKQIMAKKNWLTVGQKIFIDFKVADQVYLKEYQNILSILQNDLNQSHLEFSSNTKVEALNENITELTQYFDTKKMSVNHANILEYEALWHELERKLFKTKVVTLAPWKSILQKIENTILEANVGTDAKEKVLEKLYFLREAANNLNNLFTFSNSYLTNSKKVKIHITLMQDIVRIKKDNIILLHELMEYLRGISLLAFLGVSLTILFSGWLRSVIGLNLKNNVNQARRVQTIPAQTLGVPGKYLVNDQELHAKVTSIVDSVLIGSALTKMDYHPGINKSGKKRNKNHKRIGRDLSKNIN